MVKAQAKKPALTPDAAVVQVESRAAACDGRVILKGQTFSDGCLPAVAHASVRAGVQTLNLA
eukprot:5567926-Amphidinium_carterae.1